MSIVIAILILGFIIFIHEFGHFLFAKLFNVPVKEFSIGMGPRLISKVVHNTRYSFKAFPLGGSCAMIGEDIAGSGDFTEIGGVEKDDGTIDFEGVIFSKEEVEKNNFSVIAPWKKFFICFAGPGFNFLLAFILAIFVVMKVGFDVPIISGIAEDGAASVAKPYVLMANDEIVNISIPGESEKVGSYRDLALFMQLNNDDIIGHKYPMIITFERDGKKYNTVIEPKVEDGRALIGVTFENVYKPANSFVGVMRNAVKEVSFYIRTTVMSLRLLLRGRLGVNDVSGPVGTVKVMGDAIDDAIDVNIVSTIYMIFTLTILISANLGVMNLLPIPALDGGRIVFAVIEMIIGRPINKKIEMYANAITMILLLLFMVWIFGMDIYKLITFK